MGGNTDTGPNGRYLNLVSLRDYLETRIDALQIYLETRIGALEKATDMARGAMEIRLAGMNEFRDTLKDQTARMPTRTELEAAVTTIERELRDLREFKTTMEAKASQKAVNVVLAISVVSLVVSIVRLFI